MYKEMLKLSSPLALANIISLVSVLINTKILAGHSICYLYLLSIYLPLNLWIISIFESFKVPATAMSAAAIDKRSRVWPMLMCLSFVAVILVMIPYVCLLFFSKYIMALLSVKSVYRVEFYIFAKYMLVASIPLVLFNIVSGALSGLNKACYSLVLSLVALILNISLTWGFIHFTHLGYMSLAISTFISYMLVLFVALISAHLIIPFRIIYFHDVFVVRHLVIFRQITIPVWMSYGVISLAVLAFNFTLSRFSVNIISAFGVAYRIQTVIIIPALSIGTAAAIYINSIQAPCSKQNDAYLQKGLNICILFYVLISFVIVFFAPLFAKLITKDFFISIEAAKYLRIVGPSYIGLAIVLFYSIVLDQTGYGKTSLCITSIILIVEFAIGYCATSIFHQVTAFYWTIYLINIISGICMYIWFEKYRVSGLSRVTSI